MFGQTLFAQDFARDNTLMSGLNSPFAEEFVTIHPSGAFLAFTRANHPYNQGGKGDDGDIWLSEFDSIWHAARNWHEVNTDQFSSPIGWSNDGNTFLYNLISTKGGQLKTEIWAYTNGRSQKLDIAFFKNKSQHQSATLSADNRFLIVSMESGSTQGVEDLYLIRREGGKWAAPKNLGAVVNTKYQEITPFLAPDNHTLYFATNGRDGEGSFDIFKTTRLDDTWRNWSEPENLGPSVNSSGRETSFTFARNASEAYFISTRNSDGYGDVRRIKFKSDSASVMDIDTTAIVVQTEINVVGLQLFNAKSGEPIVTSVQLKTGNNVETKTPDSNGLIPIDENRSGIIESKGFMTAEFNAFADSLVIVRMEPLEAGRTIRLDHVLFRRGTASILETSFDELDRVVDMMKVNPEVRILLKGHTDGNGDPVQNLKLSDERASATKKYLVSKGISRKRISSRGFGGTEPIASNESEETRKLNRRVEIEVIE